MIPKIVVDDKINEIKKPWSPIVIARVNDQVIRLAMFKGTYPFHKHDNEDELFYVLRGSIIIQIEKSHQKLVLNQGEMAVIPKGKKHSPTSEEESYVLMFEPAALKSSGD
ncbi:MAG: cupin domain-containing protein [Candidatus Heimdallarchaeota archaeon]|nr:MAG: cupin domain-containing protein [Candidatus Heimdallarchaeota archaeon]